MITIIRMLMNQQHTPKALLSLLPIILSIFCCYTSCFVCVCVCVQQLKKGKTKHMETLYDPACPSNYTSIVFKSRLLHFHYRNYLNSRSSLAYIDKSSVDGKIGTPVEPKTCGKATGTRHICLDSGWQYLAYVVRIFYSTFCWTDTLLCIYTTTQNIR
jgi:hypothetical protein